MSTKEKLETIIQRDLQGSADLELLPNGRVAGHVISPVFEGLDYEARSGRIRAVLKVNMTPQEQLEVSTLLTYTPDEWKVILSDVSSDN